LFFSKAGFDFGYAGAPFESDDRYSEEVASANSLAITLASVAEASGLCVWHMYEDLGRHELDSRTPDREHVHAAIELIASMHTRFSGHPLLGEIRLHGGDYGIHFYQSNLRDSIYALKAWQPALSEVTLRENLLRRLNTLWDELPARKRALDQWGGPETLLHGDLWSINVFVIPTENGWHARLIDWDHAAVGPASYDLSTFLLRFPEEDRPWVLDLYRQSVSRAGWHLPSNRELNQLFETHEYARFANHIIWSATALAVDRTTWGVEHLTEIMRWFEKFRPVLPDAWA